MYEVEGEIMHEPKASALSARDLYLDCPSALSKTCNALHTGIESTYYNSLTGNSLWPLIMHANVCISYLDNAHF